MVSLWFVAGHGCGVGITGMCARTEEFGGGCDILVFGIEMRFAAQCFFSWSYRLRFDLAFCSLTFGVCFAG